METLRLGSSGEQVEKWQSFLRGVGLWNRTTRNARKLADGLNLRVTVLLGARPRLDS